MAKKGRDLDYQQRGMSKADYRASYSGGNNNQQSSNNVNTGSNNASAGNGKSSFPMPVTFQLAKSLVIDPITKGVRQQQVKGENIFGKAVGLPASRDYYRATGKPIDVMSLEGKNYMKDAGLIKPSPIGGTPSNDPRGLCPDGTFPPCKLPGTQIKNPVTTKNTFLSGFQSYDDGGEVVISGNVDKDLL